MIRTDNLKEELQRELKSKYYKYFWDEPGNKVEEEIKTTYIAIETLIDMIARDIDINDLHDCIMAIKKGFNKLDKNLNGGK